MLGGVSQMNAGNVLKILSLKRSKKRDALKKVLKKLDKKQLKLTKEIKSEKSKKKLKKLEIRLKTVNHQRKKAKKLIAASK